MAKWTIVKKASELDEINKQIEELQKRKQQLESKNNVVDKNQEIINENIGKWVITRGDGVLLGDSPDNIKYGGDSNEWVPAKGLENVYFFDSKQEAEESLKQLIYNHYSILMDKNDIKEIDEANDDEYENILNKKVENTYINGEWSIIQVTRDNIEVDNYGYPWIKY